MAERARPLIVVALAGALVVALTSACGVANGLNPEIKSPFILGSEDKPPTEGEGEFPDVDCNGGGDHQRCIDEAEGLCDDGDRVCKPADDVTGNCDSATDLGERDDDVDAPYLTEAFGDLASLQVQVVDTDGHLPATVDASDLLLVGASVINVSSTSFESDGDGGQNGFFILSVAPGGADDFAIAIVDTDGLRSNALCVPVN
jgi:hypothetical protein